MQQAAFRLEPRAPSCLGSTRTLPTGAAPARPAGRGAPVFAGSCPANSRGVCRHVLDIGGSRSGNRAPTSTCRSPAGRRQVPAAPGATSGGVSPAARPPPLSRWAQPVSPGPSIARCTALGRPPAPLLPAPLAPHPEARRARGLSAPCTSLTRRGPRSRGPAPPGRSTPRGVRWGPTGPAGCVCLAHGAPSCSPPPRWPPAHHTAREKRPTAGQPGPRGVSEDGRSSEGSAASGPRGWGAGPRLPSTSPRWKQSLTSPRDGPAAGPVRSRLPASRPGSRGPRPGPHETRGPKGQAWKPGRRRGPPRGATGPLSSQTCGLQRPGRLHLCVVLGPLGNRVLRRPSAAAAGPDELQLPQGTGPLLPRPIRTCDRYSCALFLTFPFPEMASLVREKNPELIKGG